MAVTAAGCGDAEGRLEPSFPPVDAGTDDPIGLLPAHEVDPFDVAVATPAEMPDPVFGGTLTPALTGDLFLAAEPARDRLHVVDMRVTGRDDGRVAQLDLQPGDTPWRSVAVAGGWIVSLRGGAVLRVDAALQQQWRTALPAPRGLDVHEDVVWVATAGGALVALDTATGEERTRHELLSDLRDVVVVPDGTLYVSRFHSAEVLQVRDGALVTRFTPPDGHLTKTRVAWRLAAAPAGRLMLLTQLHGLGTISNEPPRASSTGEPPPRSGGYGAAAPPQPPGEEPLGAVTPQIITFDFDFGNVQHMRIPDTTLVVDAAASGRDFIVADTGGHAAHIVRSSEITSTIELPPVADLPRGRGRYGARGLATAVAFDSRGIAVVQSAGDSQLRTELGVQRLSDTPVFDGGRVLFHESQDTGLACASCHPEGGDDGHVWTFAVGGPRRTQPLGGGLLESAPFHWDGSIPTMEAIVRHNMNLMEGLATDPQVEAVIHWMESIPAASSGVVLDADTHARGEAAFEAAGCASCHTGNRFSDGLRHRLRGTVLDTPSLRGAGMRSGLFHDGCVPDVASLGTLTTCRDGIHDLEGVSDEDRDVLVRYVATR